jgi:aspartyl-tRNA(Asn)/glutamyl-tRNA(Gln) amidotransferase subunit C
MVAPGTPAGPWQTAAEPSGSASTMTAMASPLTREAAAHVAVLARLDLTEEELERFTGQLGAVLEHAADVASLDTSGVPPTAHPLDLINVLREDVVRPCLDRDEVLAMAPAAEDGRFRVPKILGDAP